MSRVFALFLYAIACCFAMTGAPNAHAQAPTIVATGASSNGRLDIVVPASGLPLVVYQDGPQVKAMQCANAACIGAPSSTAVIANLSTSRIRAALAADGLPIIGLSVSFSGLRAVKCSNANCTLAVTTVVDPGNLGNSDHALIVPPDGNPVFAIFDANNGDLKVARCANAGCTGGASVVVADAAGFVGRAPAIALIGGLPQIAYNADSLNVKLLSCGNMDCTVGNSFIALNAENAAAISMIEGRDGAALIAYNADTTTQDLLRLIRCVGVSCATSSVSTIDKHASGQGVGAGVQMRSGADGLPVMSYFDLTLGAIKVARCARSDCASTTLTTVHAPAHAPISVGGTTAMTINGNGVPVVAYALSGTTPNLIVNSCNTRSCL
jgi:hypothetical protein